MVARVALIRLPCPHSPVLFVSLLIDCHCAFPRCIVDRARCPTLYPRARDKREALIGPGLPALSRTRAIDVQGASRHSRTHCISFSPPTQFHSVNYVISLICLTREANRERQAAQQPRLLPVSSKARRQAEPTIQRLPRERDKCGEDVR